MVKVKQHFIIIFIVRLTSVAGAKVDTQILSDTKFEKRISIRYSFKILTDLFYLNYNEDIHIVGVYNLYLAEVSIRDIGPTRRERKYNKLK